MASLGASLGASQGALAALLLLAVAALLLAWRGRRTLWLPGGPAGKLYRVNNAPGAAEVAARLALLEARARAFLADAERRAPGDARLANIRERWDGTLSETPVGSADVAYSVGKGAISLCVRGPGGGVEGLNTSMFVLLHELAHVATDQYGHSSDFWDNMRFLLELADASGAYEYQRFEAGPPQAYCGTPLTSSPLTCVKDKACASTLPRPAG